MSVAASTTTTTTFNRIEPHDGVQKSVFAVYGSGASSRMAGFVCMAGNTVFPTYTDITAFEDVFAVMGETDDASKRLVPGGDTPSSACRTIMRHAWCVGLKSELSTIGFGLSSSATQFPPLGSRFLREVSLVPASHCSRNSMGQRFQVFLIARVSPRKGTPSHRCVGAFHHQWCYEILPLRALHRFLALLREKENAALVRDELRNFDEHHDRQENPRPIDPAIPCPYAVSLLSIAWTTDLEHQSYLSNYSFANGVMDAGKDCWQRARQHQNNTGICVIDITDVDGPGYCFVNTPGTPALSAYEYIRIHKPTEFSALPLQPASPAATVKNGTSEDAKYVTNYFVPALEVFWALVDLAGCPQISASTLCEIWLGAASEAESRRLKVPPNGDLPMPLDVVVSLYIGFAAPESLADLSKAFAVDKPHVAIGKAILPPYAGTPDDIQRRVSAVRSLLSEQRAFDFVLDPPYPRDGPDLPVYTVAGERERRKHSILEQERFTTSLSQFPPTGTAGGKPSHADIESLVTRMWNIATILNPVRLLLTPYGEIPTFLDSQLPQLVRTLQRIGDHGDRFLDLSGLQLSALQVIKVLRKFPGIEALSLSDNKLIEPGHLPAVIASTPSLRRLHVMHFNLEVFPKIHSLLHSQSAAFRQLESLACPPLLSPNPQVTWPASFIFHYSTQSSMDESVHISVPLCTPAQVVQALNDILPLAFLENRYGESAELWYRDPHFATHAGLGPNRFALSSNGFPFYMAAQMCIHAVLASSTLHPGQPWSGRPIVGVPSHGAAYMLSGDDGGRTWMFCLDWDHRRHMRAVPGKNKWGFVRCDMTVHGHVPGDIGYPDRRPPSGELWASYDRSVYDLRGYLRCMADEGRPLPDTDAVERLESILGMRDSVTMEPLCALMTEDDLEPIVGQPTSGEQRKTAFEAAYRGLTSDKAALMSPRNAPSARGRRPLWQLRML